VRSLRFETTLLAAAALSLAAATALAQGESLEGTYQLTIDGEAAQQRIERAIESATDDMGPLRETIAANRLEDRNPAIDWLTIDLREDTIWIRYGDESFDLPRGHFGDVPVPGGETAQARARIRGGTLLVDWRMEDGRRHDVFELNGDTLQLTLRTTSEKLPDDVQYLLPFRRSS